MKTFDVSYFDKLFSRHANIQHIDVSSNSRNDIFTAVVVVLVLFAAAVVYE